MYPLVSHIVIVLCTIKFVSLMRSLGTSLVSSRRMSYSDTHKVVELAL